MMLWQGGDVLLAFPWAQCVCGVGFPAAWGAHPRAFQQETPPSDGTFYSPWSSPSLPLQIVSDSWCQGWVREEVVASVLPCHPPARHRLSPGSEQSSTTQGLLAGTENSRVSQCVCYISGPYVSLQWLNSRTFQCGIVEMLERSSLACIVHGSDLFGWKMGCCLQQLCNDPALLMCSSSSFVTNTGADPGVVLKLPLMHCFK